MNSCTIKCNRRMRTGSVNSRELVRRTSPSTRRHSNSPLHLYLPIMASNTNGRMFLCKHPATRNRFHRSSNEIWTCSQGKRTCSLPLHISVGNIKLYEQYIISLREEEGLLEDFNKRRKVEKDRYDEEGKREGEGGGIGTG